MAGQRKKKAKKPASRVEARKRRSRGDGFAEYPCIPIAQDDERLLLFAASAKELWSMLSINRRLEDKDEGYQRALSPSRQARIARFIDARRILPTAIVVSLDEATLSPDESRVRIPRGPDAGWVIDGQHRLAGAHKAETDITLPVVAFVGLDLEQQVDQFVTINREQKGVPASLYLDLLKRLPPTKSESDVVKERAAELGTLMKMDEQSPFYARIVVTTSPKRGEISLTNFVRKVVPLVRRDGRLHTFNDEYRRGLLENYYRAFAQVFPNEYKKINSVFFRTLGFGALMEVFPTFLDLTVTRAKAFKVSDAIATAKLISHFDFAPWHQMGTGSQAEAAAAEDLRTELMESAETDSTTIAIT